jgi:hypothetical protein
MNWRVGTYFGDQNTYKSLAGISERKRPLGRYIRGWEDDIEADFNEIECDDVEWVTLALDRDPVESSSEQVMILRVSQKTRNFLTS